MNSYIYIYVYTYTIYMYIHIYIFYLLCLFHFYKTTKIQNTFTNITLHKKIMKLKEEKNVYIKLQIF